ncbi:MAG TPA: hypothetical protein VE326_11590 [Candidatus Binatia bacterium]|nr:hypothetical protein [Candidatus Binatia bacterium]
MKRSALLRKIRKAANTAGVAFGEVREGGDHSIFRCGSTSISVPRHREINEFTARGILRDLEDELGKGWWR